MVMAVPTPQCVGREFVRQYYTLLNREPLQLHRFYTKNSLFLHGLSTNGSTENPILGQESIYDKIKDLNFSDCHTKIRQVDSHPTLGDGVVVQVSGELSNNGQPMRRFMQTFVLAPGEGPKKYYVHNDIFHYQDEVFPEEASDDTPEGNVDSENEDDAAHQVPVSEVANNFEQPQPDQTDPREVDGASMYYNEGATENREGAGLTDQNYEEPQELQEVVIDKQPEVANVADDFQDEFSSEATKESSQAPPSHELTPLMEETGNHEAAGDQEQAVENASETEERATSEEAGSQSSEPEKPKSWAALAGKMPSSQQEPKLPPRQTQQTPVPPLVTPPPRPKVSAPRLAKESRPGFGTKPVTARNAPDNHQVFIGNLPNGVSNADVEGVFSKYGNILEIRLNPKNFGFVIFDSAEPVVQILAERPIKISGHEINIEEKKPSGTVGRGGGGSRRDGAGSAGRGAGARSGPRGAGPVPRSAGTGPSSGNAGRGALAANGRGNRRSSGGGRGGKFNK